TAVFVGLLSVPQLDPEHPVPVSAQVTPAPPTSFPKVTVTFNDCPWSTLCEALGLICTLIIGGVLFPHDAATSAAKKAIPSSARPGVLPWRSRPASPVIAFPATAFARAYIPEIVINSFLCVASDSPRL